jgi:hypothetical protein
MMNWCGAIIYFCLGVVLTILVEMLFTQKGEGKKE